MNDFTYTFQSGANKGTSRTYSYDDILGRAKSFKDINSGSADAVTMAGLNAIALSGGDKANEAQEYLNYFNYITSDTVVDAYHKGVEAGVYTPYSKGGDEAYISGIKSAYDAGKEDTKGKEDAEKTISSEEIESLIASIIGKSGEDAANAYNNNLAAIEEQRKYAEELAELQKEQALKDAYTNYDKSKSTYGRNAEQLAQMGLSNSGYSDYLNGVAYSSMIGGVQDAHENANNAVRDAYYTASQAKAEAADAYYDKMESIKSDAQDKLVSILSAVGAGEIDGTTAANIAKAYGMGDDALSMIDNTVSAYENAYGDDTTNDTTTLTSAVTGGDFVKDDFIKTQLQGIKASDASMGDLTDVDAEFEAGNLTVDDIQPIYFAKAVKWIEDSIEDIKDITEGLEELDRLKYYKKISNADYENLKQYMYNQVVTELENDKYAVTYKDDGSASVRIREKDYTVSLNNALPEATKEFFEKYPNREKNSLIMYNGNLYLYDGTVWCALGEIASSVPQYNFGQSNVPHTPTSENYYMELKTAFNNEAKNYSKEATSPQHQK